MISLTGFIRAVLLSGLTCLLAAAQEPVPAQADPAPKPSISPEEIERIKAENARAVQINALSTRAQTALNEKKWAEAADLLQQMIATDPNRWEFQQALGNALLNLGKYEDAIVSYENALPRVQAELAAAKPGEPAKKLAQATGQMLASEGNCYIKLNKSKEAIASFRKAAEVDPNPSLAFWNLAATCYNLGRMDEALFFCNKTIAVDPARADAYFIKGSVLMGNASIDNSGKIAFPPGMVEALQKYLELKPDGPHAGDVKVMLDYAAAEAAPKKK
jgi:tetratricopeptide (TPR) repeat protein